MKKLNHQHEICEARKRYNHAIVRRDVDAICTFFSSDYFVMTGRGIQSQGIAEQHRRWSESFSSDPIVCYRRRTTRLSVSKKFACAEELGRWAGKYSQDQEIILVAGVYSAKWQMLNSGKWLIQTEVFTTLKSFTIKT
ncbi:MAG: nuclear transport factor 2 family protein [Methylotenera sp.]|uniref:nuclear transport factor 2 family protein n=1 Tax=Methylotenera sp. TaxID=2051956 RepID=UPI0024899D79|nr:nuclear transport factor 2 family protein [Methylotenera sp.]MDI1309406.1 nuclear transport factor 2 family protein [Methylotenera sp.]